MTSWTPDELDAIAAADELGSAALRPDGTLRPYTTIWVVRVGGAERDATFEHPTGADRDAIDAAYRSKYGRYGPSYLDPMISPGARATTLRLKAASPTTEGHQ